MIYRTLARHLRHSLKWRRVGECVTPLSPAPASPHLGKCRDRGQDYAVTSQLGQLVLSTCSPMVFPCLHPSTALPSVFCVSSPSTAQKGFVNPSHKGTPVYKQKIQEGVIAQLPLALLSFPVKRPACVWISLVSHA